MSKLKVAAVPAAKSMPDVAKEARVKHEGRLDQVGMSHIEVPVRVLDGQGQALLLPARADAYVNLVDPKAKGIHMSRLFLTLQEHLERELLSPASMQSILKSFVESHDAISDAAYVRVSFDYMTKRPALLSDNTGWRSYPVYFRGVFENGQPRVEIGVQVAYSSTCPCSSALARQLIQDKFRSDFEGRTPPSIEDIAQWLGKESSILATPHSQRSYAQVAVALDNEAAQVPGLIDLLDGAEGALKTAVQAAVKREDEQQFALLNGQNPMFCEDAARRLKSWLEGEPGVADYRIEARHVESLHPHDAVSIAVKGIASGFRV
jgi:GTP cyclohydrolase I